MLAESRWKQHTLLLCYPPNGQPMAAQCLRHFSGQTLAHVGEWRGDTGDESFEAALAQGWRLCARLPLPCWGDTVEDLTLWRREAVPRPAPPTLHPVLACDACGKRAAMSATGSGYSGSAGAGVQLRRCRYCRLAGYCSAACAASAARVHERYHAAKLITIRRPLDFDGRDYVVC